MKISLWIKEFIWKYSQNKENLADPRRFKEAHGEKEGNSSPELDIHGSCVSRDIFNFDEDHDIKLGKYFARNSFISTVSKPFPVEVDLNNFSPFSSPWQIRMVEVDFKKELFERLSIDPANYIMIDFIDEILTLGRYKDSIFTISVPLRNSNFLEDFKGDQINKFKLETSFWKKSMDNYIKNILEIYDEERIIIHETYFVYSYLTKCGEIKSFPDEKIDYYKNLNQLLKNYYDYAKIKLPKATVINVIKDYNLAFEDHVWGLYGVHYTNDYYKHVLSILKKIIKNQ